MGMKSSAVHDSLVPPSLRLEIQAVAAEEHRAPGEIVGEALERYLSQRKWFRDVDVHAKIAQGLESLGQGNGLDGEAVMTELLAELDGSDTALQVPGYVFSP